MRRMLALLLAVVTLGWSAAAFAQNAYKNCMQNERVLGPCASAICGYQVCIEENTVGKFKGLEVKDRGAWGAAMATCQPHIQRITQCGEELRQRAGPQLQWTVHGVGDCSGRDVGNSGGATPQDSFCGPNTSGQIAVCWDGATHRHPNRPGAWCTYKNVSVTACSGGGAPGRVYVCNPQAR